MKIKELIEILQGYDGELEIVLDDGGDDSAYQYYILSEGWFAERELTPDNSINYPPTEPTKYLVIG